MLRDDEEKPAIFSNAAVELKKMVDCLREVVVLAQW